MIKLALYGYGRLAKGIELAAKKTEDCRIDGVFTRREPFAVQAQTDIPVYGAEEIFSFSEEAFDVVILCQGSPDLPRVAPKILQRFCTADGFDMHERLPSYFLAADEAAKQNQKTALLAGGWDSGLFSIVRLLLEAALPDGNTYTFWGKGISQGHSEAIGRVDGVVSGTEYTVPRRAAVAAAKKGKTLSLPKTALHRRECFVAVKDGADKRKIEREIKDIPVYFRGYDTKVRFCSAAEAEKRKETLYHGGEVIRTGRTGEGSEHYANFSLRLSSNPEFTGSMLLACARAVYKLCKEGVYGAKTVFDVPPSYYSPKAIEELREKLL